MNFLAPLFLLAAAAVAVPIVLHLVRRRPEKLIRVSNDLFLQPRPPTSQRSRKIDRWWLLLARCGVLLLAAFAFARPFMAQGEATAASTAVLRMILLDRSASMNREGVAEAIETPLLAAVAQANDGATHWLATYQEQPIVRTDEIASLRPGDAGLAASPTSEGDDSSEGIDARGVAGQAVSEAGWGRGDLDVAATLAVQQFRAWRQLYPAATPVDASLTILSDLQQSNLSAIPLSALTAAGWPAELRLEIPSIPAGQAGNVAIELLEVSGQQLADVDVGEAGADSAALRVRLQADPNFGAAAVEVRVLTADDLTGTHGEDFADGLNTSGGVSEPHTVAIAAGQRRIERWRVALPPAGALSLAGDAIDFDNHQYFAIQPPRRPQWLVLSAAAPGESIDELVFYLRKIAGDDASLPAVQVVTQSGLLGKAPGDGGLPDANGGLPDANGGLPDANGGLPDANGEFPDADVVFADAAFLSRLDESTIDALATAVAGGTQLVWVMDGEVEMTPATSERLQRLAPVPDNAWSALTASPMEVDDYLLWTRVDRSAPPFDLFGDQPVDLSKVRFWQSRRLENLPPDAQTLVTYDNGHVAWARVASGQGHVHLVASSWRRADSNLALSTKFVPLLLSLSPGQPLAVRPAWQINQPLPTELASGVTEVEHLRAGQPLERLVVDAAWRVPAPGLYRWNVGEQTHYAAANIDRRESDLRFFKPSELLPEPPASGEGLEEEDPKRLAAQRQPVQWERSQSWWRYLIIATLTLIAFETVLASRGKVQQF